MDDLGDAYQSHNFMALGIFSFLDDVLSRSPRNLEINNEEESFTNGVSSQTRRNFISELSLNSFLLPTVGQSDSFLRRHQRMRHQNAESNLQEFDNSALNYSMDSESTNTYDEHEDLFECRHHIEAGGYSDEIFLYISNKEREEFTCYICYDILKDAYQCPNDHKYCYGCIYTWSIGTGTGHDRCPVCRCDGLYAKHEELDKTISMKRVRCKTDSCNWLGFLKDFINHEHRYYKPKELKLSSLNALDKSKFKSLIETHNVINAENKLPFNEVSNCLRTVNSSTGSRELTLQSGAAERQTSWSRNNYSQIPTIRNQNPPLEVATVPQSQEGSSLTLASVVDTNSQNRVSNQTEIMHSSTSNRFCETDSNTRNSEIDIEYSNMPLLNASRIGYNPTQEYRSLNSESNFRDLGNVSFVFNQSVPLSTECSINANLREQCALDESISEHCSLNMQNVDRHRSNSQREHSPITDTCSGVHLDSILESTPMRRPDQDRICNNLHSPIESTNTVNNISVNNVDNMDALSPFRLPLISTRTVQANATSPNPRLASYLVPRSMLSRTPTETLGEGMSASIERDLQQRRGFIYRRIVPRRSTRVLEQLQETRERLTSMLTLMTMELEDGRQNVDNATATAGRAGLLNSREGQAYSDAHWRQFNRTHVGRGLTQLLEPLESSSVDEFVRSEENSLLSLFHRRYYLNRQIDEIESRFNVEDGSTTTPSPLSNATNDHSFERNRILNPLRSPWNPTGRLPRQSDLGCNYTATLEPLRRLERILARENPSRLSRSPIDDERPDNWTSDEDSL